MAEREALPSGELWEDVRNHPNYEISKNYPYQIRNKSTNRCLKFSLNNCGYQMIQLNGISYCVHRIIAIQWLPNTDPAILKEVNHKNHNRSDNRLENLEWVSVSENRRNRMSFHRQPIEYVEEIPVTAVRIDEIYGFPFDRYYFDYDTERLIMESRGRYRYVNLNGQRSKRCTLIDANGEHRTIGWDTFLKAMREI